MVKDDVIEVENRTSAPSAMVSSSTIFFLATGDLNGEFSGDSLPLLVSVFSLGVPRLAFSCSFPFGITAAVAAISSSYKPFLWGMSPLSLAAVGT